MQATRVLLCAGGTAFRRPYAIAGSRCIVFYTYIISGSTVVVRARSRAASHQIQRKLEIRGDIMQNERRYPAKGFLLEL